MNQMTNLLDALVVKTSDQLHTLQTNAQHKLVRGDSERGSVTIEQVLWAVAMIAIVGIVVAVITSFVTTQAAKIV